MLKTVAAAALVVVIAVAGGVAVAAQSPDLSTGGPTELDTAYTGVFTIGERTIRQFRYEDDDEVDYTFTVSNPSRVPLTLVGLAEEQEPSRLLSPRALRGADGASEIEIGAGGREEVTVTIGMDGCESLSARAGSYLTTLTVRAESLGLFDDVVTITLPEELRTGSPREKYCPDATSTSRPRA